MRGDTVNLFQPGFKKKPPCPRSTTTTFRCWLAPTSVLKSFIGPLGSLRRANVRRGTCVEPTATSSLNKWAKTIIPVVVSFLPPVTPDDHDT